MDQQYILSQPQHICLWFYHILLYPPPPPLDRQGDTLCNCNYINMWLPPTPSPRGPFLHTLSFIYFARLYRECALNVWVCWRNSTRRGDWRNTHLWPWVSPLLFSLLSWSGGILGFWQGSVRDHSCKCFLSYELYNHLSLFLDRTRVLTSLVNQLT